MFYTLSQANPINFESYLTLYHTIPTLKDPKGIFENTEGKGENAGHQHFSFSHSVFFSIKERNRHFSHV